MNHPSPVLDNITLSHIRKDAGAAEHKGRLSPGQMDLIHQHRWLHLFVPASYGGLEMGLPEAVRLEEDLAYADGSLGWVVTLCGGAALFIGYFNESLAYEVFDTPQVCLAGSGRQSGTAVVSGSGFIVNGSWPYCSGAPHATHFTANCVIEPMGELRSFIFRRDEVNLHADWQYMGLNATGGHGYSVRDLFVPLSRAFDIRPDAAVLPQPVYRYPFLPLAEATISANISGMCCSFIDLAEECLTKKAHSHQRGIAIRDRGLSMAKQSREALDKVREKFYTVVDSSWQAHISTGHVADDLLAQVGVVSRELALQSRLLVNMLYPYCGLDAARTGSLLNQVWRNIHTASQHTLLLEL